MERKENASLEVTGFTATTICVILMALGIWKVIDLIIFMFAK